MKNKKSLFIGVILALFSILLLNGIIQYLLVLLFDSDIEKIHFSITGLSPILLLDTTTNTYVNSFLLISPFLINILFLELAFIFLNHSTPGTSRYSGIVFLLFIVGYLIVATFYGMIELIISSNNSSFWGRLVKLWYIEGYQIYVLIALVMVIVLSYLQYLQKRLMKYLVINKMD